MSMSRWTCWYPCWGPTIPKSVFGASAACIALGLKRLIAKAASTFDAWRTGRPNILVVTPKSIDKRYEATKVGKTMGMAAPRNQKPGPRI